MEFFENPFAMTSNQVLIPDHTKYWMSVSNFFYLKYCKNYEQNKYKYPTIFIKLPCFLE